MQSPWHLNLVTRKFSFLSIVASGARCLKFEFDHIFVWHVCVSAISRRYWSSGNLLAPRYHQFQPSSRPFRYRQEMFSPKHATIHRACNLAATTRSRRKDLCCASPLSFQTRFCKQFQRRVQVRIVSWNGQLAESSESRRTPSRYSTYYTAHSAPTISTHQPPRRNNFLVSL